MRDRGIRRDDRDPSAVQLYERMVAAPSGDDASFSLVPMRTVDASLRFVLARMRTR